MEIDYSVIQSMPDGDTLHGILQLHKRIFGSGDDLINKMKDKPRLLVMIAKLNENVIGYKVGYELDSRTFYSWLGAVSADYGKHGIASRLLVLQHQLLIEYGYQIVQTKTMNKWRDMLILNIKHGFDVMETYTDKKGRHKIVLEKKLIDLKEATL
ncbi:GNAT family N-acetyltransferase [[Bacillus] enclensis]|uniref:GNAT family N-acetyltransferase n=1 Tax=[Bacillus] enclensis TaxID=1402860 RepID=UPI001E6242AC|nr:GNAT family N-acetyltransferase [[Bacillus] enclensis]